MGISLLGFSVTTAIAAVALLYLIVFAPNVDLEEGQHTYLHIPTGSNFQEVMELFDARNLLHRPGAFQRVANRKNYPARVIPGRYRIEGKMNNNDLVDLLRSGLQESVNLTFNNIHTLGQLASVISSQLEPDSATIMTLLTNPDTLSRFNVDTATVKLIFIPNTYQVYWNTSPIQIMERMQREHQAYWSGSRLEQARRIGLSPTEVGIMASIVQRETAQRDEMARIAGVYMNRLQRNIPLQADPTVVYAVGDPGLRRVLNHHLRVDSPYNTYLHAGLPPGPITLPEPTTMDAVLRHEEHEYLFFCARDDFSGYHAFARTYSEHLANARRYHRALNQRQIMN